MCECIRPVCAVANKNDGSAVERIVDGEVSRDAEFHARVATQFMRAYAPSDREIGVVIR